MLRKRARRQNLPSHDGSSGLHGRRRNWTALAVDTKEFERWVKRGLKAISLSRITFSALEIANECIFTASLLNALP